jgi:hypothetical protein
MRLAASALWAVAILGCVELPPIEYETEHLRIGTDLDGPLCEGTLVALDQQVQVVEEALEFEVEGKLELYVLEHVGDFCDHVHGGCYDGKKRRAYAMLWAAPHELVHAAAHQVGQGNPLFGEGLATDLTGEGLRFSTSYPSSNLAVDSSDVSQETAGHFMRWLRSQYSAREIKEILVQTSPARDSDHAKKAFEEVTGDSFEQAQQDYFASAPEFFAGFDIVAPPTVEPVNGGWDIVVDFDCRDQNTEGYRDRMWRRFRIEVPELRAYVFEVTSPGSATITFPQFEDVPVGGEVFDESGDPPTQYTRPTELEIGGGTYDITVHVEGVEPVTVGVRLHPKIGTTTTVP